MKIFKVIKKIFIGVVSITFLDFAGVMTFLVLNYNEFNLTQFDDTTLVLVNDKITSDQYEKGDLVLAKKPKIAEVEKGMELFTYKIVDKTSIVVSFGKVGEVFREDDTIALENGEIYKMDYVIGAATNKYAKLGGYLSLIQSKIGFLFIVVTPLFFIFTSQIFQLIIEIKYGDKTSSQQRQEHHEPVQEVAAEPVAPMANDFLDDSF